MRGIVETFGEGRVHMHLRLAGLLSIQEDVGKSPWELLSAMSMGEGKIAELDCVFLHGMLDGGANAVDAATRLASYKDGGSSLTAAYGLALAALVDGLATPDTGRRDEGGGEEFSRANVYKAGFAMSISPAEVNAMDLYSFMAALDGFTSSTTNGMSAAEKDEIWEWLQTK